MLLLQLFTAMAFIPEGVVLFLSSIKIQHMVIGGLLGPSGLGLLGVPLSINPFHQKNPNKSKTRWWSQRFFIFTPQFGEDSQFDNYFSKGLKPPTRQNPKATNNPTLPIYLKLVQHATIPTFQVLYLTPAMPNGLGISKNG